MTRDTRTARKADALLKMTAAHSDSAERAKIAAPCTHDREPPVRSDWGQLCCSRCGRYLFDDDSICRDVVDAVTGE